MTSRNAASSRLNSSKLRLTFTASGTTISANSPTNAAAAPPGDYMLFLVDAQGVPSVSTWVRVGA